MSMAELAREAYDDEMRTWDPLEGREACDGAFRGFLEALTNAARRHERTIILTERHLAGECRHGKPWNELMKERAREAGGYRALADVKLAMWGADAFSELAEAAKDARASMRTREAHIAAKRRA